MSTQDPKSIPAPPASIPRRPRRGLYRALAMLVAFLLAVTLIFPLAFGPAVDLPYPILPGNPTLLNVKISNQNLTPFTNLEYTCQLGALDLKSGVHVTDATVVNKGRLMRLPGRKAINVQCETAYLVNAPMKNAEYKLTLNYRVYPWAKEFTKDYRFTAVVDAEGHVTKWIMK